MLLTRNNNLPSVLDQSHAIIMKEAVPPWIGYCFSKETHLANRQENDDADLRKTKSLVGAVAKGFEGAVAAVAKGLSDVIAALEYRVFVVFGSTSPSVFRIFGTKNLGLKRKFPPIQSKLNCKKIR